MRIALLEDEPSLSQYVCEILHASGFETHHYFTGAAFLEGVTHISMDLFILDWNIPDLSGLEVMKALRTPTTGPHSRVPVLFLTSRIDDASIATALHLGADDYCQKPIHADLLRARVNALLPQPPSPTADPLATQILMGYEFNAALQSIQFKNSPITVSASEYLLALYFFQHVDRALSNDRLIQAVWGLQHSIDTKTLEIHISLLRKKLQLGATSPHLRIQAIYGYGYRLSNLMARCDGL